MEDKQLNSFNDQTVRFVPILRREIVAQALKDLWQQQGLAGEPLIFPYPSQGRMQTEHHPQLLDQLVAKGKHRKRLPLGQLASWKRLAAPSSACGIASAGESVALLKSNLVHYAEIGDRGTLPAASYDWLSYTFSSGWTGLSVYYYDSDSEKVAMAAIPPGFQDEWLEFLKLLDSQHEEMVHRQPLGPVKLKRGRIEIVGASDELADVIKKASLADVVLHDDTLAQIARQHRIFDPEVLRHYAALRMPRLRKVLLIGPPGTGKTTLLHAQGAQHAKNGGLVLYVCYPPPTRATTPFQQLARALYIAEEHRLPTMVLVEDFEMFVFNPQELQLIFNTLDGIATPDNPAGTLLLATSSDPERIDQRIRDRAGRIDVLIEMGLVQDKELAIRFLKHFLGSAYRDEEHAAVASELLRQPGSHFREVCISATIQALEQGRDHVSSDDIVAAHHAILAGRAIAYQPERFVPSSVRRQGRYFSKSR